MNARSRFPLFGSLLVGAAFAYGFVSAREEIFPYPLVSGLARRIAGPPAGPPPAAVTTWMDDGWWWPVRRPGEPFDEDILSTLDKLGYLQSYQPAEEEYGVTLHDRARSQPGLNLIVSAHEPEAILADLDGEVLHSWRFDFEDVPVPADYAPPGTMGMRYFRRVRLLEDGELLALYERTGLIKLDRDSNLIWSNPFT